MLTEATRPPNWDDREVKGSLGQLGLKTQRAWAVGLAVMFEKVFFSNCGVTLHDE